MVNVSDAFLSRNYVDIEVSFRNSSVCITFVYGSRDFQDRCTLWNSLVFLGPTSPTLRLVLGDFNDIMYDHEKHGVNPGPRRQTEFFETLLIMQAL